MQLSPDGLAKLYDLPVEATIPAMNLQQQMMQSGELANQSQGIENLYKSQNNPLLVEQTRLENQSKLARLPGEAAQARSFQLKADRDAATQEGAIAAALRKFQQEASDADISMLENQAQMLSYSMDPNERAKGEQLLRMHKDIVRDREKQDAQLKRQIQLERERGTQARLTQGQAIDAGKYVRAAGGGVGKSIGEQIASGKLNFEKAATMLSGSAFLAEMEGDMEKAAQYRAMADQYTKQHIASRQAAGRVGQEGKPDIGAMGSGGIPTMPATPAPQFQPLTAPNKPPATQVDGAMFQKAFGSFEPDKYDYRIGPNGVPQRKLKGN